MTDDLEARLQAVEGERQEFRERESLLKGELELARMEGSRSREEVDRVTAILHARETEVMEQGLSEYVRICYIQPVPVVQCKCTHTCNYSVHVTYVCTVHYLCVNDTCWKVMCPPPPSSIGIPV